MPSASLRPLHAPPTLLASTSATARLAVGGVGLYLGNAKSPAHAAGTLLLTRTALLFVPAPPLPPSSGLEVPLAHIRASEHYAGFLSSSPKVTLRLAPPPPKGSDAAAAVSSSSVSSSAAPTPPPAQAAGAQWLCGICAFANSGGTTCALCGVARPAGAAAAASSTSSASHSRQASGAASPAPPSVPAPDAGGVCGVCTFANHPSLRSCEICGSPLAGGSRSSSAIASNGAAPTDTAAEEKRGEEMLRIAFRQGRDREFYKALQDALRRRTWEEPPSEAEQAQGRDEERRGVGIDGIVASLASRSASESASMSAALRDLAALAAQAEQMVALARALSGKLARAAPDDEAAANAQSVVSSSLVRLGLEAPALTAKDVADERAYHAGLARELASLLLSTDGGRSAGLMGRGKVDGRGGAEEEVRGVVGMDEAWCFWNRARGVALVSPAVMRAVTPYLPALTSPSISTRVLRSGSHVLHTPRWADDVFGARLVKALRQQAASAASAAAPYGDGLSSAQLAAQERAPLGLVAELVETAEASGLVVRDESEAGVRWYENAITTFAWDPEPPR